MAELTAHTPGAFCWPELGTTDSAAAARFYHALFGWDADVQPVGPGETYTLFKLRGKDVAAAYTLRPEQRQQGVPAHWGSYVSVANAADAANKAKDLGATVLAGPFDVMQAGRMAVLRDPEGALFSIWEARASIGARIVNEPGALGWTELNTRDVDAARRFYSSLFGWTMKRSSSMPDYTEFSCAGTPIGGMITIQPEWGPMPANWMPYFVVSDCDEAGARAAGAGGTVLMTKDIERVGRFALVRDPQGAVFSVIALAAST